MFNVLPGDTKLSPFCGIFGLKKGINGPRFDQESKKKDSKIDHMLVAKGHPEQWKLILYSPRCSISIVFLSQVRRVCTAFLCIRKNIAWMHSFFLPPQKNFVYTENENSVPRRKVRVQRME